MRVCAQGCKDTGDVRALKCVSNLYSEEAKTQIKELRKGQISLLHGINFSVSIKNRLQNYNIFLKHARAGCIFCRGCLKCEPLKAMQTAYIPFGVTRPMLDVFCRIPTSKYAS